MKKVVRKFRVVAQALVLAPIALAAIVGSAVSAGAAVKLSPQNVVDLALSRGYRARGAELTAQRSYAALQNALGVFDLQFTLNPQYEYNQSQAIAALAANPIDRTQTINSSLSKQFRSGTNLELDYMNILQNSTLPNSSTRTPNLTQNMLQLQLRQNLWKNVFGYADRLGVEIGQAGVDAALEQREQDLQAIILDAMNLFWNTYIAERQLQENIAAREKYVQLVKNVRQKAGFNLSTPGELPRLQAELENVDQRVKQASATYLNTLRDLLTAIKLDTTDSVELEIPAEIPAVPQLAKKDPKTLRAVRIAKVKVENAERALRQVKNQNSPKLDFVAKVKSSAVDEFNDQSLATMEAGTRPYYFVGFEFSTALDSDLVRGRVTDAGVVYAQSQNDYNVQLDTTGNQLVELERTVASEYEIAKSTLDTVEYRAKVVRELEIAYRQGRQPLVELIRAYNDLFTAQQDRAKAIGNYHIGLNQLAAARDELVASVKR